MTTNTKKTKTAKKIAAPARAKKAPAETKHPISQFTTDDFYKELIACVNEDILSKLAEYIVAYPCGASSSYKARNAHSLLDKFLWKATPEGHDYWYKVEMHHLENPLAILSDLNNIQFAAPKEDSKKDAFNVSNSEANSIVINVPGYVLDTENSTPGKIVLKAVTTAVEKPKKPALPKTWEELENVGGWFVTTDSKLSSNSKMLTTLSARHTFATEEQAKAAIALAQLSQLREVYRQGWVPDWSAYNDKHCIRFYKNTLIIDNLTSLDYFLSFQTSEIAEEFLENFRDLIEQAKPLMS